MGRGVTIHLEVFLPFRGRRTWRGEEEVPAGTTAGALPGLLGLDLPELAVLVGGRHVADETPLTPGDEVIIIPRSEGG